MQQPKEHAARLTNSPSDSCRVQHVAVGKFRKQKYGADFFDGVDNYRHDCLGSHCLNSRGSHTGCEKNSSVPGSHCLNSRVAHLLTGCEKNSYVPGSHCLNSRVAHLLTGCEKNSYVPGSHCLNSRVAHLLTGCEKNSYVPGSTINIFGV
ncbi:hypothetical protein Btru_075876 [Bulinus truncatus]|nr:hypothetical protein Btru_075876 [Bulinus truncatus]